MKKQITVRLLRHATLVLEINGKKILIDPMLSPKDALDPVKNCGNEIRIPMVELPTSSDELTKLLNEVHAVVITHIHRDHWDVAAQNLIDKSKLLFCQPGDEAKIKEQGFKNVQVIESSTQWEGITIHRTSGRHGTGEIGKLMGQVSGFVFTYEDESIYIAGDTIWCKEVEESLNMHKPKTIVLNAGGAKFLTGDPITMTPGDILKVHEHAPAAKIIAVHMDAVNHCFIKRTDLSDFLSAKGMSKNVLIPKDGEEVNL